MSRRHGIAGMVRRIGVSALAAACCAGLVVASAAAGARVAPAEHARPVPAGASLDYSPDGSPRLRRLSATFVQESLGVAGLPNTTSAPLASSPAAGGVGGGTVVSTTYACVNGHQTGDPLSPPCVPSFTGDNGGSTYQGVTGDEIRLLVTIDPSHDVDSPSLQPSWGGYYDLWQPATQEERGAASAVPEGSASSSMPWLHALRVLQDYFNRHFQTYGRRVHFIVYSIRQASAQAYRTVALENDILVRPFAVLAVGAGTFNETNPAYLNTLADRGVVAFDSVAERSTAFYARRPGLLWGYRPTIEESADLFGSYICQKVVHQPAVMSGNPGENGSPRRLGMLEVSNRPTYAPFAALVRKHIEECGGEISDIEGFPEPYGCGGIPEGEAGGGAGTEPARAMAIFKAKRITTVIWPGCVSFRMARAAQATGYLPEWVLWGQGLLDANWVATSSDFPGGVWSGHAVAVTPTTFQPLPPQRFCFQALREIDPDIPADFVADNACDFYEGLRQVFSAVQLAGPRLTPSAMDRGVRTVTPAPSNPQTPRCFYPGDDRTCIKDAEVEWWDWTGDGQSGTLGPLTVRGSGCWRAMEGGRRYEAGHWPGGNIDAQIRRPLVGGLSSERSGPTGTDPCNMHGAHRVPT